MLHAALLCLLIGQVPPPPAPHAAESYAQSTPAGESPSADNPQAQREWLLNHLAADLQAQGRLDDGKYADIKRMIGGVSDSQIAQLVQSYRAQELAAAEANLRRLQAYRDALRRGVERRQQVYQQEQALSAYGSALAAQQAQWAMGGYYVAPYYSYSYPPYSYPPYPRYRRRW